MPQLFQVLRCYKCLVFQVHQIKKLNKWECKMCGEKQSVKRHYGLGTARDCRLHVQKLNSLRGVVDELQQNEINTDDEFENVQPKATVQESQIKKESKWANYVEEVVPPAVDINSSMYLNDTEVVLELPQKRKTFLGNRNQNKKNKTDEEENDEAPQTSIREEALCSDISLVHKSKLKLNNEKNKIIKCNQHNESSGSIKESEQNGKHLYSSVYEPALTLPVEFSYSSKKKELNASNQIVMKYIPPTINKNSKWAQFADEEEHDEPPEETEDLSPCIEQFCEVPKKYSSSSKDCGEEIESPDSQSQNKSHALFALCDDIDLDTVLDL